MHPTRTSPSSSCNVGLLTDLQAFVNSRLDWVGQKLKNSPDYQREQANLDKQMHKLQAALSDEQAITLQDMDDSNLALLNMYEYTCYCQGFKDALRLIYEE